ncbi:MAG TPA: hypothetical protein EYN96_06630, partial [Candidatus Hydrogenedentes bacterium]|nr:hypothetical protein [Candidatus Hydrogenedentota bacterium]
MKHSSTSNSRPDSSLPKLTSAGGIAIAVFLSFTVLIQIMPDHFFVEGDSIVIRNMKLNESEYLTSDTPTPTLLLMGSSRLMDVDTQLVSSHTSLSNEEILNLSAPSNSFFFIDAFLRQHPKI